MTGKELDREVRAELSGLGAELAREIARRLVMVASLIDEDPEAAWEHAQAARRRASRIGVVREAAGLAGYRAGHYAEALAELRTARRITGSAQHLPILADCERGLGRPERALELVASPEASRLDPDARIELLLVEAGARRDLDQLDAAIVALQVPRLRENRPSATTARLRLAYADALAAAGRGDEAAEWTRRAAEVDPDGGSGASLRLDDNADLDLYDLEEDAEEIDEPEPSGGEEHPGREG